MKIWLLSTQFWWFWIIKSDQLDPTPVGCCVSLSSITIDVIDRTTFIWVFSESMRASKHGSEKRGFGEFFYCFWWTICKRVRIRSDFNLPGTVLDPFFNFKSLKIFDTVFPIFGESNSCRFFLVFQLEDLTESVFIVIHKNKSEDLQYTRFWKSPMLSLLSLCQMGFLVPYLVGNVPTVPVRDVSNIQHYM